MKKIFFLCFVVFGLLLGFNSVNAATIVVGSGSCTPRDHNLSNNDSLNPNDWWCDSWTFTGVAGGGPSCSPYGYVGGQTYFPRTGGLIGFVCYCAQNLSCAANTCVGSTCSDGCGGTVAGTKSCCTPVNATLSGWSACSASCGGGTQTRTCSGASCGGSATCGGAALSQSCNTQTCISAPTGLSAVCGYGGTVVYLYWNLVSGAVNYPIRADKNPSSWSDYVCSNAGSLSPSGDYCQDLLTYTSKNLSISANTNYQWWVHAQDSAWNWSAVSIGSFNCPSAYTITVNKTGSGTVTSNPSGINCGSTCSSSFTSASTVTLTAAPSPGYAISNWSGACSGFLTTCTVTMDSAKSVSVTFVLTVVNYTLTVAKAGTGSGTVTSNPAGINCGSDCTEDYTSGESVTLTASPASGSTFAGWSGGICSGTSPTCTFNMNENKGITANFNLPAFLPAPAWLSYFCNTDGSVDISWASVSGATYYSIRLDKHPPSWDEAYWDANCSNSGTWSSANDYCDNRVDERYVVALSISTAFYKFWIHARNDAGMWGDVKELTFSCGSPPAPTNLNSSCSTDGTSITLSWSPVSGTTYAIRLDKNPSSWDVNYWETNCSDSGSWHDSDFCQNHLTSAAKTLSVSPNTPYQWWVHSISNSNGLWSSAAVGYLSSCTPTPVCGDGTCNGTETCSTCAADCGPCGPVCGDGTCNGTETCSTCAADCGACGPSCGDGSCNGSETCSTCAADCGACGIVNQAPVAVATVSKDGSNYSDSITVTQGIATPIYLSASGSSDPNGWTDSTNGVSSGGKCEWNRDLNQGSPTFEPPAINNPASPSACNISLGNLTFNDAPGTYTYQVLRITDKPGLKSNVNTVQITVQAVAASNQPPSATSLSNNNSTLDYCSYTPSYIILSWVFSDEPGDTQSAYRVRVTRQSDGTTYDSGQRSGITSSITAQTINTEKGSNFIWYGDSYTWQVKVWDNHDAESAWALGSSFTTPKHAYPDVYPPYDFIWNPLKPAVGENTQFTDRSACYDINNNSVPCSGNGPCGSPWCWTFLPDGSPSSATIQNPIVKFLSTGAKSVTLRATDSDGFSCQAQKMINSQLPLPVWIEIPPF